MLARAHNVVSLSDPTARDANDRPQIEAGSRVRDVPARRGADGEGEACAS
jgi:hypothetical protein